MFIFQIVLILFATKLAGHIAARFGQPSVGALASGFNVKSSMGVGAGMVSHGEVALILAAMGLESGLLPANYYTSMIIVVIVTTIVTPPLLKLIFGHREVL